MKKILVLLGIPAVIIFGIALDFSCGGWIAEYPFAIVS